MSILVGIIGGSTCSTAEKTVAERIGYLLAKAGATVVCGGLGGVMEAACKGAKKGGGTTVGILPGFTKADANPYVDIPIVTGMSIARNIVVVRSADVIIAIGGLYGTLSEIGAALNIGKTVIAIQSWALKHTSINLKNSQYITVKSAEEAVETALQVCKEETV
jgi:hypothetical protein